MNQNNVKSFISNFSIALVSQVISLVLSLIMSLLVPKVLGVEEFGYWQLFIFYSSYTGLFHFGLNDGIYLIHGGETRDEVDKRSIASQFQLSVVVQLFIAVLIVIYAFAGGLEEKREFIIVCTACYMILFCASGYLGNVFQMMNETKLFSLSAIVDRLVFFVPLAFFLIIREQAFEPYVLAFLFARSCSLGYCLWKGKDLIFVKPMKLKPTVDEAFQSIRVGICLMLANLAGTLIIGVARFAIDFTWGIDEFGQISLALSMVNFFMVFFTQLALVLFPALRQTDYNNLKKVFSSARDALGLSLPVVFVLYFPAVILLHLWLPQYDTAMIFFAVLLPICVFDGKMQVVGTTFFNVLRKERQLLAVNAAAVALSFIWSLIGALVFHSAYFVMGSVVVVLAVRSTFSECLISYHLKVKRSGVVLGTLIMSVLFEVFTFSNLGVGAFILSLIAYSAFLFCFRKKIVTLFEHIRALKSLL